MKRKFFAYPYIVWMVLFIVVPMLFIFYYAFNVNGEWTTERFVNAIKDADTWTILLRSILIAFGTTVICLLLGYPIAYILSNMKKSVAGFISILFFVPMWMNFVLRTYAWSAIIEYAIPDLFKTTSSLTDTATGRTIAVLLVMVYDFLPFMVMPLYNTLSKLDKSLLEASRDLGADGKTTFFRVVLPLSVPGIVSGITMVFVPSITAFTVPQLIGNGNYNLYGNKIEQAFMNGNYSVGSTLSIVLLILVLLSTLIMNRFDKDKEGGSIL
jgi:ABC-type spermidine/putrescine transport system, permease component I